MRNATELLADYAAYHRDRRNIASHLVGVPMIVMAVCVLLSRPAFEGLVFAGMAPTPAWLALAASAAWYLTRGARLLGVVTSAALAAMVAVAALAARAGSALWLGIGLGLFVAGWAIQLVGHRFEGRKPAFVDDIVGLMIGPMFVVAELLWMLGWNPSLRAEVERRAGPTVLRERALARP